ncbi:uncharacterized protein UTRI_00122_B [Ustilago trichophora]|uniref:Uncharacterized protein n=1 Tax=Ustilago trichophora TaxID=86804 RepID=A0A5C3DRY1_9BASI|nr:uncharacterized protein UTRI_00122_B [Ustilago trichophora]
MNTANKAALPFRNEQHRYPPASTSYSQPTHVRQLDSDRAAYDPGTVSYTVHTETNGISDLRLQVSQEASSSKQPLRPVYLRERVLTEQNEIVDNIIDVNTGRICWTIHRPTRGWYLYLRSPVLPSGTAISIRSAKRDENDPTASPLTFSVNTKVRMQPLARVKPQIHLDSHVFTEFHGSKDSSTVHIDSLDHGLAIQAEDSFAGEAKQDVALAATGRENRKTSSSGHARRRSGATGSGTHMLDSKHPSSKRPSSAVTSSPMIPEIEDEDHQPSHPNQNPSLSRLAIPTTTNSSSSSPLSAGGDRPYSPTQPSTTTFSATSSAPRTSTFLLNDGAGPKQQGAATQSWARWACSILPSEIRPSLSLDTNKSFSLYWTDPPESELAKEGGVEVVRFEDQSGRWMWNSHTRGRLSLQTSAMQAVGLEQEFWITAALAYIQFLEDKDAYDAARDA